MSFAVRNTSPIIFILGSTATGKSKLSIELAKKLNGEVISADSMQVYEGLNIITNKVTEKEKAEVRHHLIDIVSPPTEFSVTEFRKAALDTIQDLFSVNKLPIVVGGTNYYIESLLWDFLIDDTPYAHSEQILQHRKNMNAKRRKLCDDGEDDSFYLFDRLKSVDPERAAELHPNNIRKIARSLQVFETTGRRHSELIKEQKQQPGASHLGGPLRFSKALIFWLVCEQNELNQRISERVEVMLTKGLDREVSEFYKTYKKSKLARDANTVLYEEGLFQAIGFKEFHDYFTCDKEEEKKRHLESGMTALKRVTIKYSKKQKTWVRNRFLSRHENTPNIYQLDATHLKSWDVDVLNKALDISLAFIEGKDICVEPIEKVAVDANVNTKYSCDVCGGRIIMGNLAWQKHQVSRRHSKLLRKLSKKDT